jgi:hypothetical protein
MTWSVSRIIHQRGQDELGRVLAGDGTMLLDHFVSVLVSKIGYSLDDTPDRIVSGERRSEQSYPFHLSADNRVFTGRYTPNQLVPESSAVNPRGSGQDRSDVDVEWMTTSFFRSEE